ncbi:MAG: bifunctional phosphopantothenoylcysteine decarboxylase/phosphopantothenate--cysteine ligase CoaBC [Peptococcaceae bacterium]|nr:bifunctional phosphopantothenoylcysteine decarboxylase/phosphopantothenate--cysteine ligase CoaBC [Peptococcaceae bacterium]
MRKIVVGVTGGIAAYKAAELVSLLRKKDYEVRCVMTEHAQEFITPLTLETLSANPVITDLFAKEKEWNVEHIALANWADCFCIVPATANILAKAAHGLADDFLSTCLLATKAPIVFAPAMNDQMYLHPATQENMRILEQRGCHLVEPVVGNLACGTSGKGKMASPETIVAYLQTLGQQDLAGYHILVTAGPTQEAIDPVRYLTNHSTGKMGYAIAERAKQRGAEVTLVTGKTNLQPPVGVKVVSVVSACDMAEAVFDLFEQQDIVIKTAAVADYRPKVVAQQKIKKGEGEWQIILERNPDILAELGKRKGKQLLVGFAAETNDVESYAQDKLQRKNLDFIVANDLTEANSGFGKDTNQVIIFGRDGSREVLPVLAKTEVADRLLNKVVNKLKERKDNA